MADRKKELPADLVEFRDSYVEMFGTLPPLPAARFQFSGEVNPQFMRIAEQLRAHAFYNDVFDMKTTQLILFGMLAELIISRTQRPFEARNLVRQHIGRAP